MHGDLVYPERAQLVQLWHILKYKCALLKSLAGHFRIMLSRCAVASTSVEDFFEHKMQEILNNAEQSLLLKI